VAVLCMRSGCGLGGGRVSGVEVEGKKFLWILESCEKVVLIKLCIATTTVVNMLKS
jgi:hypothetical protein